MSQVEGYEGATVLCGFESNQIVRTVEERNFEKEVTIHK